MFENYREMSADEKAQVKAIHKGIRKETGSRAGNLAWGFVREFPYRRIERKTRTQEMGDGTVMVHNQPNLVTVAKVLAKHIPGLEGYFKSPYTLAESCPLIAWAANPDGAIPAQGGGERASLGGSVKPTTGMGTPVV
jgi:hypothetical protein